MGIDWAREKYEMRLEENWPLSYRLRAVMVALLIMPLTLLLAGDRGTQLSIIVICGAVIAVCLLKSNVRWTIRSGEILIERNWIDGRRRVEFVQRADIIDLTVLTATSKPDSLVWLLLRRYSGPDTESPKALFDTPADDLKIAVETRLNVIVPIKSHMAGLIRGL